MNNMNTYDAIANTAGIALIIGLLFVDALTAFMFSFVITGCIVGEYIFDKFGKIE